MGKRRKQATNYGAQYEYEKVKRKQRAGKQGAKSLAEHCVLCGEEIIAEEAMILPSGHLRHPEGDCLPDLVGDE